MRKLLSFQGLFVIALLFTVSAANAQSLRVGVLGGVAVGDAGDVATANLGVDGSLYFINIKDKVDIGVSTGYTRFFGKDETVGGFTVEYDDFAYIPITASGRGLFGEHIVYIADVGYAVGLDDVDGGLLYQAKIGYTNSMLDAFFFYRGISSNDLDISTVGLGVSFKVL